MKVTGNVQLIRPSPQHPHFWAPNSLHITATPIGKAGKRARIKAEHTMIDDAKLVVSSEWTRKEQDELETIITLKDGNTFKFRMFAK